MASTTKASMKATPEDVAKLTTDETLRMLTPCLNEGHARRRGEGLANFGSFDLEKCDQLRAVLG